MTEPTSNTATAAAFLPILGGVAVGLGQGPMILGSAAYTLGAWVLGLSF